MSRKVAVLACLALAGCGIKIPNVKLPDPGGTMQYKCPDGSLVARVEDCPSTGVVVPTAKPPSAECTGPNQCGCSVQQSAGVYKHVCCTPWLTGGILLADDPKECPAPPVTPPIVKPPAFQQCIRPGQEYTLQPRTAPPASQVAALTAALEAETGCPPSSRCPISGDVQAFMDRIIQRLDAAGICSGRQVKNGDAVAVGSEADNCTYHIVNFGGPVVAWPPSASEPPDHWIMTVVPPVPPTTFPKIQQFGRGPDLSVRYLACRVIDATPLTGDRDYCKAEFPDNQGQWGLCPYASEDHPARRVEGETAAGPYTWTFNGEVQEYNVDQNGKPNPLQIKVCYGPGVAKVCAANFGSPICQTANVQ